MKIGIIYSLAQNPEKFFESVANLEKVKVDDIKFMTGKLLSQEIVVVCLDSYNLDQVIFQLANTFKVDFAVFLGRGYYHLPHLNCGDVMIASEAYIDKGLETEEIYRAEPKLIDKCFRVLDAIEQGSESKIIGGKLISPVDFPDKEVLQSESEQHNVYCITSRGVKEAQTAAKQNMPFVSIKMLVDKDKDEPDELKLQQGYNQIFWIVKELLSDN